MASATLPSRACSTEHDRYRLDEWITTGFGVGLTIVSVALAVYFWRRRGELPAGATVQLVHRPVATSARTAGRRAAASNRDSQFAVRDSPALSEPTDQASRTVDV
jgi:hypothetical protein